MTDPPQMNSPRYRLLDQLGTGAMGAVYRAYDRLSGHEVALKQVLVPRDLMPTEVDQERRTLATEFHVLAGLRHPHIISVLDYGFDGERQPFYTMELLAGARTILEAGNSLPLAGRVALLTQSLEALAYLHRRGILHHDLKPANMLVADQRMRLLDFGLAVLADQQRESDAFGTLLYLAPEVLDNQPYTVAADLYSLGVIAYELLVGRHPFPAETVSDFLDQVLYQPPDLAALAVHPALAAIMGQLLAKTPAERPPSAQAALVVLRQTLGLPEQASDMEVRESYLQAATFVGRAQELGQLTSALEQARHGHGSAWLIGGESGVGKSRLLDELRIQALVQGVQVLRGQGIEGGGLPYQHWREPLRHLALATRLSDLEASVLKLIVPDIAGLLEHTVPDAPALSGAEQVQRLIRVMIDLLRRPTYPLLLILEDLHWADESLEVLKIATRSLADRPLLIVASYRDDERPHLPDELPEMAVIPLPRLMEGEIAQLSTAMLGESGHQPEVLALLKRETEGNTFFMVEVVRALAEVSGRLTDVGRTTLPAQVFTGGVQRLVQRRLQRVPPGAYPLVQLAAVLGRQIDQAALQAAIPQADLNHWLYGCAEAQVLEVQGEQWRFAHDKLRAGVLLSMPDTELRMLHHQAAVAITAAYADDLRPQAGRLAEHFHQTGDLVRERDYARQAGDYAAATFAHAEAARHYSRALELTDEPEARFALLLAREEVYDWQGQREAQTADLQALAALADQLDNQHYRTEVALRQQRQTLALGDLPGVIAQAEQALALAHGDQAAEATARLRWGIALCQQGKMAAAQDQLLPALELARSAALIGLEADCLLYLGNAADHQGDYRLARAHIQQALDLSRTIGDRQREVRAVHDLAISYLFAGEHLNGNAYLEEALQLSRSIGLLYDEELALLNLGFSAYKHGNYDLSETLYQQALQLARTMQNQLHELYLIGNFGELARDLGDYAIAQRYFEQGLAQSQQLGARQDTCQNFLRLSGLALNRGQAALGERYAREALTIAAETESLIDQHNACALVAKALRDQQDYDQARVFFDDALALMEHHHDHPARIATLADLAQLHLSCGRPELALALVEFIQSWIASQTLSELNDPVGIMLICYKVLVAQHDSRAAAVLQDGYDLIQARAASISDPARRQVYLTQVQSNRELLAAWEQREHHAA